MKPEPKKKKTYWMNVYRGYTEKDLPFIDTGHQYASKKEAKENQENSFQFIKTIKIKL